MATLNQDLGRIASLSKKDRRIYRRSLLQKEGINRTLQEETDLQICNLMRLLSGNHFNEH